MRSARIFYTLSCLHGKLFERVKPISQTNIKSSTDNDLSFSQCKVIFFFH